MPSLMDLSRLLTEAPQDSNNPFLRQAMKGAQSEFIQPPPIDPTSGTNPVSLSSGQSVSPFDAKLGPSEEDGPSSGTMNTGQGSGFQNRHVLDSDEPEARPGFFQSDEFKNIANMGMGLLGGAAGGALAGNWRAGMAGGGEVQLKDFQAKQKDMLDRRHKAWESAYNEAAALPADIHTTPGMEEVAKAQQALMKDLQDGKVDNEQNLTNFLKVKAMYGGDIEQIAMNRKMADQKRMEDEKFQNEAVRSSQRAIALQRILGDPMAPDAEKMQAQAELATINKDLEMQKDRDATRQVEADRWSKTAAHQQRMEVLQQQGYNTQLAGQNSRERIANAQIQSREQLAQKAQFGNRVKAMVSQSMRNEPEVPEQVHFANAIKALGGVEQISPGNVMIMGEPVQLQSIFGDRPELWDADGTPSAKGWNVLYSVVANDLELASTQARQPQDLSLTGAYAR